MRIDKFLWSVRIFKTRNVAAEACKSGRVTMSGQFVKSSRAVKEGDVIEVKKTPIWRKFKVKKLLKSRVGAKLVDEYVQDLTPAEELEKLEIIRKSGILSRPRGLGRPTKKERRDIDKLLNEDDGWPLDFDDDGDE
ncbi:RNA-binding S4 domain-containing protein [Chondrinema litorale]|uniref:RNA-binding S4 domain-containing protein n=1 Tax=Chondrinema litorale TaxID=2994555 RepID=UPI002543E7D1|nr:S4 domain-containing protein [Chondrinema litorale]UZR93072.1 S4 domain-containing protein [Chondrinema litorale]